VDEKGLSEKIRHRRRWLAEALSSGPPVPGARTPSRAAAVMLLLGAGLIVITVALPPAARGSDLLILGYGAVLGLAGAWLIVRSRASELELGAVAALGTAVITLSTLEAGTGVGADDNQVLYLWVCVYSFWFLSLRHALLQLGLIGAADAALLLDQGPSLAAGVTQWLVVVATFTTVGLLVAWLHRSLERQRKETTRLAVVAERIRIARELHDAAGGGVTAVSIQAAAGLRFVDRDPEATKGALEEIVRTSKLTLEDMRRLLGVLRLDLEGDRFNRVSLARLDELTAECRRAGVPIEVGVSGEPFALPEALDQAAYRIVEEALANVLKHGGVEAKARLRLSYETDALGLEVTNKGRPPAEVPPVGARGLSGIRERVDLFGGSLEAGALDGGGFRVYALLPVAAPVTDRS
jgi:signal transduction histidine kinase